MPALVIKAFPPDLHAQLKRIAAAHRRSVTQLLPRYKAMLKTGAFSGGTDSTIALSEERDA